MARKILYSHFVRELFARTSNGVDLPSRVNGVESFPISRDILIFVFDFSSFPMIGGMNTFWLISGATASSFLRGSLDVGPCNRQPVICRAAE